MQHGETITKKTCISYGLLAALAWNGCLAVLVWVAQLPLKQILSSQVAAQVGMAALLIIWSVVWYFIGYQFRKKYLRKREAYRAALPKADQKNFDQVYFKYHLAKNSRAVSMVLFIAIPWYLLLHVQGNTMHGRDYWIVGTLLLISVLLYGLHKRYRNIL